MPPDNNIQYCSRQSAIRGASVDNINHMILKLTTERETVRTMMKDEVESMMRMGAEIAKMKYPCKSTSTAVSFVSILISPG